MKQDGTAVREAVELPPWAHGDPHEFLRLQRAALEGAHASAHLHSWIDLVFGCLQRGPAARDHDNLFHPLTYEAAGGRALARAGTGHAVHTAGMQRTPGVFAVLTPTARFV